MRWTEQFYLDVFRKHGGFRLREHGEYPFDCQQLQSQGPGLDSGLLPHGLIQLQAP
jgi:hypothetical protein